MPGRPKVRLDRYDNSWYSPGRGLVVRAVWLITSRLFFLTVIPWPSLIKRILLRLFGSSVGEKVVIKPGVNIKYPWNLSIGNHSWIGEGVWIDSLVKVTIGTDACLSQGAMIETGNHDWSDPAFGLIVKEIEIDDGAWVGAQAILLPGSQLATHSVLTAGSVLSGSTPPYSILGGNPATCISDRSIRSE
jgi:putative colanic acid biosynthesis acetyltransferase WcaF